VPDLAASAKFDILREVLDLARAQETALEANAFEDFDEMLQQRELLLQRLGILDAHGNALPENVIEFPIPADVAADDARALDAMIKGILEQDRRNESLLAQRMQAIRASLPDLTTSQRASVAYRSMETRPSFIDRAS